MELKKWPFCVGGITPVWFSWYWENTDNFQSLYLGFKWSLIHDILSHYYDTLVTGNLVEIHKFKKELLHLVAKKVCQLWFCTRPYWEKDMWNDEGRA